MAATTRFYFDTLLFPALLKAINEATSSIELMTFIFKTSYVDETRARQRGVQVFVILNYSRFEHEVCVDHQPRLHGMHRTHGLHHADVMKGWRMKDEGMRR